MQKISKKKARESDVRHSDPIVLRDSRDMRIEAKPFFVRHKTRPDELKVKIESLTKSDSSKATINLREEEAKNLVEFLMRHFAVTQEQDGEYIVIRIEGGEIDLRGHDPSAVVAAVLEELNDDDVADFLNGEQVSDRIRNAFKGAIKLREMQEAISELESMLDDNVTSEQSYQDWCFDHSWVFGNAYVMRDDTRDIAIHDTVDLLMPSAITGFRDIVELKAPDKSVIHPHDNRRRSFYFSSDVSKTIGQCHRYLDMLHRNAADGLDDYPLIVAYHPRATIVIGRSEGWGRDEVRALHGLNYRLSDITVMTYDGLLAVGRRIIDVVSNKSETRQDLADEQAHLPEKDDDLPF